MTVRDEAALFSVHGITDIDGCPTAVAMGLQVRRLDAVAQEEGIPSFLRS